MNRLLAGIVEAKSEQIALNFVNEVRKLKHYKLLEFDEVYKRGRSRDVKRIGRKSGSFPKLRKLNLC